MVFIIVPVTLIFTVLLYDYHYYMSAIIMVSAHKMRQRFPRGKIRCGSQSIDESLDRFSIKVKG